MKLKSCLVLLGILLSIVLFVVYNGKIIIVYRGVLGYLFEYILELKVLVFV